MIKDLEMSIKKTIEDTTTPIRKKSEFEDDEMADSDLLNSMRKIVEEVNAKKTDRNANILKPVLSNRGRSYKSETRTMKS